MPSVFGVYRGIYASLVDDPDFQRLTPHARHILQTMRISRDIGPACIWRAYLDPICQRTGWPRKIVERSLAELATAGWIEWDGVIIWIKNGLRYDPTFKIADPKHLKAVQKHISSLPKREIVVRFCEYYQIPCPFEAPSKTLPSLGPPNPNPNPNPNPISESEVLRTPAPSEGPDELQQAWNEAVKESVNHGRGLPGLRPCRDLSDTRRKKASIRLKEAELAWHRQAMLRLAHSRFACGGSEPTKEHPKPFRASFDWYIDNDVNCLKAYEGRYDD